MTTNSEVIQRVQSIYSKGAQSRNTRLTSRHIYSTAVSVRAKLLKQRADKKQNLSQWNFQTIPCVALEEVPKHECPCLPPVGCTVYRSKVKLPKPLATSAGDYLISVASVEHSIQYDPTTVKASQYKSGNRYTKVKPEYYILNEYLYITHKGGPLVISVTGIFEDPLEASNYPSFCEEDCVDCVDCTAFADREFAIDKDLIHTVVQLTLGEIINLFPQAIEDRSTDSKDSDVSQIK